LPLGLILHRKEGKGLKEPQEKGRVAGKVRDVLKLNGGKKGGA